MSRSLPFRKERSTKPSPDSPVEDTPQDFRAKSYADSFRFAWAGLRYVFATQRNFRTHVAIGVLVCALSVFFGITGPEWAVLLLTIALMLTLEALNTAIELTIDLVTQGQFNPYARIIKDVSAGACLLAACLSVAIGLAVFGPYLFHMLERP